MIKVAISGAGSIAERAHLPALRSVADFHIAAIQSRTEAKAARLAESLASGSQSRPNVYTDFDEMLAREHPDAVCVFTPNHLHAPYTIKALAAGAHVLCEKPMATSAADARQMVDEARRREKVLMVAMQRRYGGIERALKRAAELGVIGQPHFIRSRLSHGGPENWAPGQQWFTSVGQAGGGAMLDLGVHVTDLAIWMLGEIESVSGRVATLVKQIEVEDTGAMLLRFRSGALGVIEASWSSRPGLSAMEIYGSEGRAMAGYPRLDVAVQRADGSAPPGFSREEILGSFKPTDPLAPFRMLAQNFADAIAKRAEPSPDGEDGLRALEAIEACYRSSKSGAAVKLPLA